MPYTPVPNVVQVELVWDYQGEVGENVLHFLSPITPTVTSMSLLGQQMVDWFSVTFKDQVPIIQRLMNVKLTDLSTQNGPVVDYSVSLPMAGTRAGAALPSNCALVITKRTAKRGRSYRGRTYLGLLTETDVTANQCATGWVTSMMSDWGALLTRTTTDGVYKQVVVSRFQNNAQLAVGIATEITAFTTDGTVDSQRRRLP